MHTYELWPSCLVLTRLFPSRNLPMRWSTSFHNACNYAEPATLAKCNCYLHLWLFSLIQDHPLNMRRAGVSLFPAGLRTISSRRFASLQTAGDHRLHVHEVTMDRHHPIRGCGSKGDACEHDGTWCLLPRCNTLQSSRAIAVVTLFRPGTSVLIRFIMQLKNHKVTQCRYEIMSELNTSSRCA